VEHLFSSKFSCPLCDYSLSELEPRLFSFNSPVGACPTCGGLGVTTVFDRRPGGRLSLAQPGERRSQGLGPAQRLHLLAARERRRHYGFDIDTAFEELPESAREVLLRGSGSEEIEFVYEAAGPAARPARSSASIRSKASCPTSSAASRKPTRSRCART
jgi:excinuclease ABC subunit A